MTRKHILIAAAKKNAQRSFHKKASDFSMKRHEYADQAVDILFYTVRYTSNDLPGGLVERRADVYVNGKQTSGLSL